MTAHGYKGSFGDNENVLKLIKVTVQLYEYSKNLELYTLKWVKCMVRELDLNKAKKKSKTTQKNKNFSKFQINLTENTPRSSLYSDSPLYTE